MQWKSWAEIPRGRRNWSFIILRTYPRGRCLLENLATWYTYWKCEPHAYFKKCDDPEIARLEGCPIELLEPPEDWEWLCIHFTGTKFVLGSQRNFPTISVRCPSRTGLRRDVRKVSSS